MSKIKIVEGLKSWEVMKRASEGEPVAVRDAASEPWRRVVCACWNWLESQYAIIDTTAPEIDWSGFDFEFFNQYGGLPVKRGEHVMRLRGPVASERSSEFILHESPFYYWPGGDTAPVPDNVEVEVVRGDHMHLLGTKMSWHITEQANAIIAFRITGNVS